MRSRLTELSAELVTLSADLAALSMDEPPTGETLAASERCLQSIASLLEAAREPGARALLESMSAALAAARARRVLFVFVVPHLVSAAELLASPAASSAVAIEGCRYELDTMVPPDTARGKADAPDVPLEALSRGAKRDTRD